MLSGGNANMKETVPALKFMGSSKSFKFQRGSGLCVLS